MTKLNTSKRNDLPQSAPGYGIARMAAGGPVPGVGDQDTQPALLTPGEFVMPKDSVQKIGVHRLRAMKDATHTPVAQGYGIARPKNMGNAPAAPGYGISRMANGGSVIGTTPDEDMSGWAPGIQAAKQAGATAPGLQNVDLSDSLPITQNSISNAADQYKRANGVAETTGAIAGGAAKVIGGLTADAATGIGGIGQGIYGFGKGVLRGAGVIDPDSAPIAQGINRPTTPASTPVGYGVGGRSAPPSASTGTTSRNPSADPSADSAPVMPALRNPSADPAADSAPGTPSTPAVTTPPPMAATHTGALNDQMLAAQSGQPKGADYLDSPAQPGQLKGANGFTNVVAPDQARFGIGEMDAINANIRANAGKQRSFSNADVPAGAQNQMPSTQNQMPGTSPQPGYGINGPDTSSGGVSSLGGSTIYDDLNAKMPHTTSVALMQHQAAMAQIAAQRDNNAANIAGQYGIAGLNRASAERVANANNQTQIGIHDDANDSQSNIANATNQTRLGVARISADSIKNQMVPMRGALRQGLDSHGNPAMIEEPGGFGIRDPNAPGGVRFIQAPSAAPVAQAKPAPDPRAVAYLKANPAAKSDFEQKYGAGSSAQYLGK